MLEIKAIQFGKYIDLLQIMKQLSWISQIYLY